MGARSPHTRRFQLWWAVVGSLALVVAVVALSSCLRERSPDRPMTPGVQSQATQHPASVDSITQVAPVDVTIASIGVHADLMSLGLAKDNTVQVPSEDQAMKAGWYRLGAIPGQVGAAVILGHVDSKRGPAVFFDLKHVQPGDNVDVTLSDKTTAQFKVLSVKTYANESFPAKKVYRGSPGHRLLNLVTCGGAYDKAAGGYQSNVVVYTELIQHG